MIKVLDCTLRDGGYLIDHEFGEKKVIGIIKKLVAAKIDIIEIGFLKDVPHSKGKTIFNHIKEIESYLPKEKLKSLYSVMIDYNRYDINKLTEKKQNSIDIIRFCFFQKDYKNALKEASRIKELGYKVFIQPVDIMSYSDHEILGLIDKTNNLDPYAFSIVDTFGSMYMDDLIRLYHLINHNLRSTIKIDFHSHNNLQLSFALSLRLIELAQNQRKVIIDSCLNGFGRGAGNTNTELLVNFLNKKHNKTYELNTILELIDIYMTDIINNYSWGYSLPYFIAGIHGAHVHNISYLMDKHNLKIKDLREIINRVDKKKVKRYDYKNLDLIHYEYYSSNIKDEHNLKILKKALSNKDILLVAPGKSIDLYKSKISNFIEKHSPVIISINFIPEYDIDYYFYSNAKQFNLDKEYLHNKKIIKSSNIIDEVSNNELIINYSNLTKPNWKYFDNSTIMLLKLITLLNIKDNIFIAGFDGFKSTDNYCLSHETFQIKDDEKKNELNLNISQMIKNLKNESNLSLNFLTPSIFEKAFNNDYPN